MQLRVSPIIAVSIPSAFGKQPQNRVRAEVDPAADEALFQGIVQSDGRPTGKALMDLIPFVIQI
jgi:hypothetical protein